MANWYKLCSPDRLLLGVDDPGRDLAPGSRGSARRSPASTTREPRTPPAGRILEKSPSRCPAPHHRVGAESRDNSKAKNANSKPIFSGDAPKPRLGAIAPMTWMIPKTTPRNPSGNGASNRRTPVPSDGITPTCRFVRASPNCLPSNVSVPVAASLFFLVAARKIRSKSRSRCVPTVG